MNVSKKLVGRMVEVTWKDPNSWRGALETMVRGRAALATWHEHGILYDITDGVVMIAHSLSQSPGATEPDEIVRTAIAEELIEAITVFVPEAPST